MRYFSKLEQPKVRSRGTKRNNCWRGIATKVEALRDAGRGACWLSKPEVAELIANAVRFFEGQRYELRAWVIMPNHVHAVVWPTTGNTLSGILHSWKSFTS